MLEYEAVLANASIGIAFTRDRKFFLCNPKFAEMFGWTPNELIGQAGEVVYPSRESYEALGAIAVPVLSESRQLDLEWEMRRRDGTTFLARMIAKTINPENPRQGTVWIVEDITQRKLATDELQRLLREQEAILQTASVGISFVKDRRVQRCTRRYEQMFGYAAGELAGQPANAILRDEADRAKLEDAYAQLAKGATFAMSAPMRRKDASSFWARITGRAADPGDPLQGSVWLTEDITEQRRADEEIQRLVLEQQALLNNVVVGITIVRERKIVRCNRRFEELFGFAAGEGIAVSTRDMYFTEDEYVGGGRNYALLDAGGTHTREQWLKRKDGSGYWCRMSGRAVEPGEPAKGYVWLFEDISERKRADESVQRLLKEQIVILDNATVGIAFVRDRVIHRSNRRLEEMTARSPGSLLGQSSALLFADAADWEAAARLAYEHTSPGQTHVNEVRFKRADGSAFMCRSVGRRIDSGGSEQEWIWSFDDVSAEHAAREALQRSRDELERAVAERTAELRAANALLEGEIGDRKQAEQRARHLADHDALTGLPNRRLLEDRLTQAIALSYRNRKQTAAMFVDLDRFKTINDSLGHAVGDLLLKEVAQRLVQQLREGDTVCRVGGDEFVVVLPEIKRGADAANVAQKIIETLSEPIVLEGRDITVTPSIGISVFPDDGSDAETLIRNADAAMYHAKEMGRNNYQFFTDQMNLAANRRLTLENDLRRAVLKTELQLYYQPISDLKTGCVVAHEALLRWKHPSKGIISPLDFIQLAEDTGLILKIGEQVLRDACAWVTRIGVDKRIPVAVNISARQFNDPRLVDLVAGALKESGLPAHMLELEITESTVMQQTDATLAMLSKLKELGVSLAIDDFGTGYSSLAYLKRFPVDKLKIDKSFITDVPGSRDNNVIVAAIIGLAHALGLKVVAEGVETEAQMEFLQNANCDMIQGYLAGRPLDSDAAASEYV